MITLEKTLVCGWEPAIRGMRNALNSWHLIDSFYCKECHGGLCKYGFDGECPVTDGNDFVIGENDHNLMMRLAKSGSSHAKYRRQIIVWVDITAPLYWWKEFDTYKVGTVANSCSTMHKIHSRELTLDDCSHEHLRPIALNALKRVIECINDAREDFIETKDKEDWWQMIQLLPTSFNQKRTVQLNYEVLAGIYPDRRHHKLDEWHTLCDWIEKLPYSELITVRRGSV